MAKPKIKILYSFGFAERNIESSGLIKKLEEYGYEVDTDQNVFKDSIPSKVIQRIKIWLRNQMFYRFGSINRFRKFLSKKRHQNDDNLDKWDKLDHNHGFPFPNSRLIYNMIHWIFCNLPSGINKLDANLVIVTDLQDILAQNTISYCSREKIPVLSICNSWDHLTHRSRVIDHSIVQQFVVWNEIQKNEMVEIHGINASKITIIGSFAIRSVYMIEENLITNPSGWKSMAFSQEKK